MTEFGVVTQSGQGKCSVTFSRPEACEKCGACGGAKRKHTLELEGEYPVGQWLRVEMPEGQFLQATSLAYVLPLVIMLAGLGLGYIISGKTDAGAALGALIGLAAAILLLRVLSKGLTKKDGWQPRVTAQYEQKPTIADIGCGGSTQAPKKSGTNS